MDIKIRAFRRLVPVKVISCFADSFMSETLIASNGKERSFDERRETQTKQGFLKKDFFCSWQFYPIFAFRDIQSNFVTVKLSPANSKFLGQICLQ